jgi:hypothetical protein
MSLLAPSLIFQNVIANKQGGKQYVRNKYAHWLWWPNDRSRRTGAGGPPAATETHRPIPHHEIVRSLIETLGFRHIGVVNDEYAVSPDGMKMFGVLDLEPELQGCQFSIGLRNSHDKSMRLAMTCGYRVFVCSNMVFAGTLLPCSQNTRSHSHSSTASRLALLCK